MMFYFIASSSFVIQEIAKIFVTNLKDSQIKELLVLSNCDYFVTIWQPKVEKRWLLLQHILKWATSEIHFVNKN